MALPFFRNDIAGNVLLERDTVRFIRLGSAMDQDLPAKDFAH